MRSIAREQAKDWLSVASNVTKNLVQAPRHRWKNQTDLGTTARLPSIATGANQVAPGVPQLCPAEARHIIRTTNICWTAQGSLNFVALRLLNRTAPLDCLELDAKTVKSDFNAQNKLMLGILPPKVESAKKPRYF